MSIKDDLKELNEHTKKTIWLLGNLFSKIERTLKETNISVISEDNPYLKNYSHAILAYEDMADAIKNMQEAERKQPMSINFKDQK